MIRARIRRDFDGFRIPALSLSGELTYIFTHEEFDAEQPDMIEDEEYSTIVRVQDKLYLVQSIDLEFDPFTGKQGEAMPTKKQTKVQTSTSTDLAPDDRVEPVKPSHMQVTNAQVYPLREVVGRTRAIARVVLEDQLQLTGLRVVDGSNGLFVSYPNDPSYKGDDYKSLFYPVTKELRDHIETVVLEKYQATLAGEG